MSVLKRSVRNRRIFFVQVANPGGEPYRSVNGPITFRGNPLTHTRPSPGIGEHTDEVLEEIGLESPKA